MTAVLATEALLRGLVVGAVLVALLLWQHRRPRRNDVSPPRRRLRNVALVLASAALVRVLVPLTPVAFALVAAERGWGLLHRIDAPSWLEGACAVIALDLAIYWQHRAFHRVPLLWRLHRVHHSDTAFDATLGLRFHPGEILLSTAYKLALVAAFGFSAASVLVYEILLASFALFTHADIALPGHWDARLRRLIVTPDWHRVHHSVHRTETDSNYGNLLSAWDRVFATHVPQPRDGHLGMTIGLHEFRNAHAQTLFELLRQPLWSPHRTS
jgi:sterol desaturase/sphingolipid hydroxylase (fatty acid hydroxylase superfamily)